MVKGVIRVFIGDILCWKPVLGGLFDHLHAGFGPCPVIGKPDKDQNRGIGLEAFVNPAPQRDTPGVKSRYGFKPMPFAEILDLVFSGA